MTAPQLVCVPPLAVPDVWLHAARWLAPAMALECSDDDITALKRDLDVGAALLWIVWDGEALIGAVATKITSVPRRKICNIVACGGTRVREWIKLVAEIERYARAEGCDAVRLTGRRGWKRILPEYREPWVCLQKDLG